MWRLGDGAGGSPGMPTASLGFEQVPEPKDALADLEDSELCAFTCVWLKRSKDGPSRGA